MVEVHLYRPVDTCRHFEGELLGLEGGVVTIRTDAGERQFALRDISQCKPLITFTEEDLDMAEAEDMTGEEGEASDDRQE